MNVAVAAAVGLLVGCDNSSPDTASLAPPKLGYGTKVSFGRGGNSDVFKVSGWSATEEKFTWSEGGEAILKMTTTPTDELVVVKMTLAALVKEPELAAQPVEVSVNGQKIAEWQVGNTAEFTAPLPHDISKMGGPLTISFKTPKATSPKTLGLSADPRNLGICCHFFELSKS